MAVSVEVRRGAYYDSVTLMAVSRAAADSAGVEASLVAMATELNRELLGDLGFDPGDVHGAGPNDLVVAVRADTEDAVEAARASVDAALTGVGRSQPAGGFGAPSPPRTVATAMRRTGGAGPRLALVSVPGEHAFVEAMDALRAGATPMVFSDNVGLEQEIALKAEAERRGLLVMGPDCGTAIVGGVGLGFANVVSPGPVGIVGASGTGTQQLACLLDDAGVGTRHALGVGGRDLSAGVGGVSTLAALRALDADPAVEVIAVVSKPPDPAVAERVRAAAAGCATPVVPAFTGPDGVDLETAAGRVLGVLGRDVPVPRSWPARGGRRGRRPGRLVGLFSGGTLCDEAMAIAAATLGPIASNVPLDPNWALPDDLDAEGHLAIDFGDDRFTRGRPHPMIDQRLRVERIAAEAKNPATGVLLLDVVCGHAADPDPAATLAPALADAGRTAAADGRDLAVVVSLCATEGDPQDRERQAAALSDAGASVHASNAAAAREAVGMIGAGT